MEQVIWIEILSRHHDVIERHRCTGPEIRIGRGYDNDVVLDDPYVAPRHLRVFRAENGSLVAEDAGSANGLYTERGIAGREGIVLDGNSILRIGRTQLRVRESQHEVSPERISMPPTRVWPVAGILIGALLAIEVISLWLGETAEFKVSRYAIPLLTILLVALGWAAVWAVLCRIFAGRLRFARHVIIALGGLLGFSLYNELAQYGAFALSSRVISAYSDMGMWFILALVCFYHLRIISPARLRLKAGVVAVLAAVAVVMQLLSQSETRSDADPQGFVRRLEPPAMRLLPPQNEDAFFADAKRLEGRLDRARMEESLSDGPYRSSEDDD